MLIDRHIGMDNEDGRGVMADQFCRELLFLDTLNKKCIDIWINSPGGTISDGEQIYGTILKTKTKVNTHNVGMAASIAGAIYLAGRSRFMCDYAKFMMHPVSGGDYESRIAFENSVVKMLSSRSDMTEEQVRALMQKTTWLNAEDCKAMGICTEIELSNDFNRMRQVSNVSDARELYNSYKSMVNNAIKTKTKKTMNKIANKFNIDANDSDFESKVMSKVEEIEAQNKIASDKVAEAEKALNKAKADYDSLKADYDKLKNDADAEAKAKAEKEAEELKNKSTELVNSLVKLGKIENKAELIEKFVNKASASKEAFEDVKETFDAIPAKVKGANMTNMLDTTPRSYTAQDINNAMDKKRKQIK